MFKYIYTVILSFLSATSFAGYDIVDIKEFYGMAIDSEYANKSGTINILAENFRLIFSFIIEGRKYDGEYFIATKPVANTTVALKLNQKVKDESPSTQLFVTTSFQLWKNDDNHNEQIELRFTKENMELKTYVKLYPKNDINNDLPDDEFYHDGAPNLEEYFSSSLGKANWQGVRFADLIAKQGDYDFWDGVQNPFELLFSNSCNTAFSVSLFKLKRLRTEHDELFKIPLQQALSVVLDFYGLKLHIEDDSPLVISIVPAHHLEERMQAWLTTANVYSLSIARILATLVYINMSDQANAFYQALAELDAEHQNYIGQNIYSFWSDIFEKCEYEVEKIAINPL
jgi:hypothetical protein